VGSVRDHLMLARECLCVTLKTHKCVRDSGLIGNLSWLEISAVYLHLIARL